MSSGVNTASVFVPPPPPADVSAKLAVVANELDIAFPAQLLVPNKEPVNALPMNLEADIMDALTEPLTLSALKNPPVQRDEVVPIVLVPPRLNGITSVLIPTPSPNAIPRMAPPAVYAIEIYGIPRNITFT